MPRRPKFQHRKKQKRDKRQEKQHVTSDVNSGVTIEPSQVMNTTLLHQFHSSLSLPSKSWSDQTPDGLEKIKVCKLSQDESSSTAQPLHVIYSITVNPDLTLCA